MTDRQADRQTETETAILTADSCIINHPVPNVALLVGGTSNIEYTVTACLYWPLSPALDAAGWGREGGEGGIDCHFESTCGSGVFSSLLVLSVDAHCACGQSLTGLTVT